jgi:hypothetical protein
VISAYFERMCLPLHELQVAYLVLPGAAYNPSISARSKNSTVRRTQRLPGIAKILWQRSMGVVSFFRTPSQSAMYALRCLLEVPGATLGQHTEKQTQALQRVPQTHSRFLPNAVVLPVAGSLGSANSRFPHLFDFRVQ